MAPVYLKLFSRNSFFGCGNIKPVSRLLRSRESRHHYIGGKTVLFYSSAGKSVLFYSILFIMFNSIQWYFQSCLLTVPWIFFASVFAIVHDLVTHTLLHRFGHSQINSFLWRLDEHGKAIPEGHLQLREAFFAPERIIHEGGIDPILRGSFAQPAQQVDTKVSSRSRIPRVSQDIQNVVNLSVTSQKVVYMN